MTAERLALLCTDTVADRLADRIARAAPDLDVVALSGDDLVPADVLARIDAAFFSADSFPGRAKRFMGAAIRAPRLRWLHTFSAGTDDPVFATLRERGVRLTSSSGAAAGPIGRTVMLYLLALSRGLPRLLADQAAHRWDPRSFDDLPGRSIGVLGMGPIGREIIRLAQTFGMRPIGMRRTVTGDEPCETWSIDRVAELASGVDVLAVALPLTEDTKGIVSADVIAAMRPGSVFVNVGRGELVDEPALTSALASGQLGGAGLDVFVAEPLPTDSPLWDLPNVIVTPHSSGQTVSSGWEAAEIWLDNLGRYARGAPLLNER